MPTNFKTPWPTPQPISGQTCVTLTPSDGSGVVPAVVHSGHVLLSPALDVVCFFSVLEKISCFTLPSYDFLPASPLPCMHLPISNAPQQNVELKPPPPTSGGSIGGPRSERGVPSSSQFGGSLEISYVFLSNARSHWSLWSR